MARNPREVYLLGLCVVSGVGSLITRLAAEPSTAVCSCAPPDPAAHIPVPVILGWHALLIAGAATVLVGMCWRRDLLTGALISRAGWIWLGFGAYAYAAAVAWPLTPQAVLGGGVLAGFGLACHWGLWPWPPWRREGQA